MSVAQEYADARLEQYKTLRSHDQRDLEKCKQRSASLWAAMDGELRKEAAEAYFLAIQQYERSRPR